MRYSIAHGYGLDDVLAALATGRDIYALRHEPPGRYRLERAAAWDAGRHTLGAYRQVEPVKALVFPPRETLGVWGNDSGPASVPERIVFGVKNCDLSGLAVQDHVFLGGEAVDPHYEEARRKTILVTSDCTDFLEACFCPAVGEQPFAERGFDVNVSRTPLGYLIEGGSERGEILLQAEQALLEPAADALVEARDAERATMLERLVAHAGEHGLEPGADLRAAVERAFESDLWEEFAADCVECGACNFVCCTCHCFALVDGLDAGGCPVRTRQWDSCLFRDFARTAGGGNPRPRRAERLRNRFDKKFSYFPQVMGRYACDGCGRCTEACIANIDIRKVLKRTLDESNAVHAHTGND